MQTIPTQKNLYCSKYSNISLVENDGKSFVIKHTKKALKRNVSDALLSIKSNSKSICKIYDIETIEGEYTTRIYMEYIKGRHIYGRLTSNQEKELISTVEMASLELKDVFYEQSVFPDIVSKTTDFIRIADDQSIKDLGKSLLQKWLDFIHDNELSILCIYDLHRGNLLIDETEQWHLIDIDAIVSASNTFMFSCLMAVGFLLEGYSAKWVKHQILFHHKKKEKQIYLEIMIRLYWGYAFFSRQDENNELRQKYYSSMCEFERVCPVHIVIPEF